ncbi:MAG: four helix bundle protein [bacterium]
MNIARGSNAEILYQLRLVHDLAYISDDTYEELRRQYNSVGRMLTNLIKKLRAKGQSP